MKNKVVFPLVIWYMKVLYIFLPNYIYSNFQVCMNILIAFNLCVHSESLFLNQPQKSLGGWFFEPKNQLPIDFSQFVDLVEQQSGFWNDKIHPMLAKPTPQKFMVCTMLLFVSSKNWLPKSRKKRKEKTDSQNFFCNFNLQMVMWCISKVFKFHF